MKAAPEQGVGIWSIYRNGDPEKSPEELKLCLMRTIQTAAHELGHVSMFMTKKKPHTENKAETIGADIMSMPLNKFKEGIVFDQNPSRPGIQLRRKR